MKHIIHITSGVTKHLWASKLQETQDAGTEFYIPQTIRTPKFSRDKTTEVLPGNGYQQIMKAIITSKV